MNIRTTVSALAALAVVLGTSMGASSARADAAEVALVENGVSRAPIVVFEGAPPYTRQAADELAEYIEKTSGARPEVIEGRPDPVPERAIWVGHQPVMDEIFPGLDFDFQHPEEILIAATEGHLVIAGRDRWDPDNLEWLDRRGGRHVGKQQEYGSINAVYTFLQDFLGVRWLWPGELGEDIVEQKTIAFAPFEYHYHPQIRSRGGVLHFSSFGNPGYGRAHQWTRLQRLQLGSLDIPGGHAFSGWWERFSETHREYFALQPDGTRSGFPNPRTVKLCQSNPSVWQQWLADVEAQLESNPNQTVFNASPNDGWFSGHCICENCSAWDHPEGELRRFIWQGTSQDYVALSDRHVTFANTLARMLKEKYPDKDYFVAMLSYGHSRPVPIEAVPDDNVLMISVANFFGRTHLADRGSSRGTTHREQLQGWGEISKHLAWRPNTGSPAGWQQGQPDVHMTRTIEDWKLIAELGCIGIYIDGTWEHWATHGPQYYIMAQLTWDPSQNGQAILDDYYRRAYGPGFEPMKAYWTFLEETRERFVDGDAGYPEVYDAAFFDRAYGYLDRAAEACGQGVHLDRVNFTRAGLDYTQLIVENRALMARYRASGEEDAEAERKVRENWEQMQRICEEYPYSINWGPVRPQTPRMRGLHPDHIR